MRKTALAAALVLLAATPAPAADWPADRVGALAVWDAAYDREKGTRFIPLQLIVPFVWTGARQIELPPALNYTDIDGDHWSGPVPDKDAASGQPITAYARVRTNNREGRVAQRFAVRAEQDGIGRIADSRFGTLACTGEIKFPLGEWREGETRENAYSCSSGGRPPVPRFNTITIEKLDFPCRGVPHCVQFRWIHRSGTPTATPDDDRRYVFAPGLGEVLHDRLTGR